MKWHGLFVSVVSLLSTVGGVFAQTAPTTLPPGVGMPVAPVVVSGPDEGWSGGLANGAGTPRIWITPEYLLWWVKSGPVSTPLVTTSTATGLPVLSSSTGALGDPNTIVLAGDKPINYGTFSGGRLTVGGFLDENGTFGVLARGFVLQQETNKKVFASGPDGLPILANPIIDTQGILNGGIPGGETARGISFPAVGPFGPIEGSATIISRSQLWGAEANGLVNLMRNESFMINGLVGFRYLDLREDLTMTTLAIDHTPPPAFNGGTVLTTDTFRTQNRFYGGQVGLDATAWMGKIFMNVQGRIGLGGTRQTLDVSGISANAVSGNTTAGSITGASGFYALPSNIGHFNQNSFTVIPEAEVKLGYSLTQNLQAYVGYNMLYWSSVVRPGFQIDRNIDVRQISTLPPASVGGPFVPGFVGTQPAHEFRQTDFWAQGITFGLNFAF